MENIQIDQHAQKGQNEAISRLHKLYVGLDFSPVCECAILSSRCIPRNTKAPGFECENAEC